MKENLFPNLEQVLTPHRDNPPCQSFDAYRRSRPARQTAERRAICLSRVGTLTAAQQAVVSATAEYLACFFDLPVQPSADFDPATFQSWGIREHPVRGHPQLLTDYLTREVLGVDRPGQALVYLAVTAWDLCSNEYSGRQFGSVFGEAVYGHAAVWSLRYLGDPSDGDRAFRACLRRSCAVATHEALHVLGLDHCAGMPCNMRGSACLSGPLHLCPSCLRKLCWNRQVDLLPYLQRQKDWLERRTFTEAAEHYERMIRLLGTP